MYISTDRFRIRGKSGIIIINSLQKKKGRKTDRPHSFSNGNKMIERTSSGPLCLAAKVAKIKRIRHCCKMLRNHLKELGKWLQDIWSEHGLQSQSLKSDVRWSLPSGINMKAPDWHMSVGHLEKVGQKIKALKWIGNLAWYQLGKERYPGLLPRTKMLSWYLRIKLSFYPSET